MRQDKSACPPPPHPAAWPLTLPGSSSLFAPEEPPALPPSYTGAPALSGFRSPAFSPLLHPASQSGKQLCKLTSRDIHWVSSGVPSPTGCQSRLFTLHRWERKICLFGCNCQAKDVLSSDRNSSRVRAGQGPSISLAQPAKGD